MRLRVFSDLHLEFSDFRPPAVDADAIVLAGDIAPGCAAFSWAAHHFGGRPVVFVAGNHEFYGRELHRHLGAMRRSARRHEVHFLERDERIIGGVRFLGCTLWTDFEVFGVERRDWAVGAARLAMNDYCQIRTVDDRRARPPQPNRALQPEDTLELHRVSVAWLSSRLRVPFDGPTVVVTHHAPHPDSLRPSRDWDPLQAAYASVLTPLMGTAALWVHGHVHASSDYVLNGTRVVCNPRGYVPYAPNIEFDPQRIVEV